MTTTATARSTSLQKEHEAALKFFQRAIQMDPEFTYAHTLCAHEYVANEDFEKAIKNVCRSVGNEDLDNFSNWMKEFGATI